MDLSVAGYWVALIGNTDGATILASFVTAVLGGGLATTIAAVVALHKYREERRQAERDLDVDGFKAQLGGFDTMIGRLTDENVRLLGNVESMRVQAEVDRSRIRELEIENAMLIAKVRALEATR